MLVLPRWLPVRRRACTRPYLAGGQRLHRTSVTRPKRSPRQRSRAPHRPRGGSPLAPHRTHRQPPRRAWSLLTRLRTARPLRGGANPQMRCSCVGPRRCLSSMHPRPSSPPPSTGALWCASPTTLWQQSASRVSLSMATSSSIAEHSFQGVKPLPWRPLPFSGPVSNFCDADTRTRFRHEHWQTAIGSASFSRYRLWRLSIDISATDGITDGFSSAVRTDRCARASRHACARACAYLSAAGQPTRVRPRARSAARRRVVRVRAAPCRAECRDPPRAGVVR
mmetsp:Transcript_19502/g.52530  ORF Transcript_19502/g.52530 Transcript_19502/m.52530 type:complete len:280 (+) Transcript_19502:825-1664(+)